METKPVIIQMNNKCPFIKENIENIELVKRKRHKKIEIKLKKRLEFMDPIGLIGKSINPVEREIQETNHRYYSIL
jgi:hypothetical protein